MKKQQGFVILLSVLVIGAVGLSVALALVFSGIDSYRTSYNTIQSKQATALTTACGEEVLRLILDNNSYTGTDNISLGSGSCAYTVTNTGGENRTIQITGTVDSTTENIIRKVVIMIDSVSPQVNVLSWQEVADF